MTEDSSRDMEVFISQALLGSKRAPLVLGHSMYWEVLKLFYDHAGADIGEFGLATDGLPVTESAEQAKEVPWAARFMKCSDEAQAYCKEQPRFCTVCWVDREDGIVPAVTQKEQFSGNTNWHPGWRAHQLTGRGIAFGILNALQDAITVFTEGVAGMYKGMR